MNIVQHMPSADYHAHPAVSKSLLDKVAKTPAHAFAYLYGKREKPTEAMEFGTALHTCALEPERYASEYGVFEGDRRTKAGKEAYEALLRNCTTIISADQHDAITAMVTSIRQHPVAGALLKDGIAEASVFWQHPPTGLTCKCRPDWWRQMDSTVVDLKTTDDASPEGFSRSVAKYRYHVQAAHYMVGTQAKRFMFIAIEKKPPYAVAVYELDADALTIGHQARDRDLERIASCLEFNLWPGYPAEIQTITLPKWAAGSEE